MLNGVPHPFVRFSNKQKWSYCSALDRVLSLYVLLFYYLIRGCTSEGRSSPRLEKERSLLSVP